ncbi:MAG: DUF2284 domain-containing protein [Syntrophobacteraceae bacterium]|jgi:predicted metal-binding protein|nr:DUF2284 domain-containing protein [Syntrophobacteraceae bacterium]
MEASVEREMERDGAELTDLVELARWLGASDVAMVSAGELSAEDDLARLCLDPPCENYGMSAGCPPHVAGPSAFRELVSEYEWALVFRIEVPSQILFSDERREVFRLLHEIAAEVEQSAVQMGYRKSKGFAGGSCKQLFCRDRRACRVVSEGRPCRNPGQARPSMSGFGINVSKLMQTAGWSMNRADGKTDRDRTSGTGTVCGLVLVG